MLQLVAGQLAVLSVRLPRRLFQHRMSRDADLVDRPIRRDSALLQLQRVRTMARDKR